MRTRTKLFGLFTFCVGCALLFSNTGTAQDFDPDAICRQKSSLSIVPGILFSGGYFRQTDNSVIVGADLNTDRHAMFSDSCDGDKFKAISTVNVCYIEQLSTSRWFVLQCDCNGFSNVEIKVKFSEDYKINGGVVDPRKKTFNIVIDPATQSGGFCT